MKMHPISAELQRRVTMNGGEVYEVGGCVRDYLLNLDCDDYDYVVTGVPADRMLDMLSGAQVKLVGTAFGVYDVTFPGCESVHVALPRTDHYPDGRSGAHTAVQVSAHHEVSIEDDLSRRDATVNAIALHLGSGRLIDPHGGQADLAEGVLRFVGKPAERVAEDALRIVRMLRLMVKLDAKLAPETFDAIQQHSALTGTLTRERVWQELWKMMTYQKASGAAMGRALRATLESGVLGEIIPEYAGTAGYDQGTPYHDRDLASHMLDSVTFAQEISASAEVKLALLLHDLGKPGTRSEGIDGRAHYYGHEVTGARIARETLTRLKAPLDVTNNVETLIEQHMRLSPSHPVGDRGLRRFMNDLGPLWRDSLDHRYADLMAHASQVHEGRESPLEWRAEMIRRCEAQGETVAELSEATLALSGKALMDAFTLKPGRAVGEIKRRLLASVIDGDVPNESAALLAQARAWHAEVR